MFIKLEVPIAGVIEKTNFCNQDLNTIFRIKFFFLKKNVSIGRSQKCHQMFQKSPLQIVKYRKNCLFFERIINCEMCLKNLEKRPEITKIIRGYPLENLQK